MSSVEDPSATESDCRWVAALNLRERPAAGSRWTVGQDRDPARRRLERWRTGPPFEDASAWARYLDTLGVGEEELLELLATPQRRSGPSPDWLSRFDRAYAEPAPEKEGFETRGLLTAVRPLLYAASRRLRAVLDDLDAPDSAIDRPAVLRSLLQDLGRGLSARATPTLVLELRIASLEERLAGDTPEARFEDFVTRLEKPEVARNLFVPYPVLMRNLVAEMDRRSMVAEEALRRWAEDRPERSGGREGEAPGPLVALESSGGDPHRGGRRVLFARFAGGERWVYKPRPLALEAAFQEILRRAGEDLDAPRPLRILDRGSHGWMEHVSPAPCGSVADLDRFYRRQGVLLAFLHLFGATDLHHENLVAAGDQPLAVDLETLMHPYPEHHEVRGERPVSALDDSVLRVGLLPHRSSFGGAAGEGFDASALGADPGQVTPGSARRLAGAGTDDARLVSEPGRLESLPGRPTLDGGSTDPLRHGDPVIQGFVEARRFMAERWSDPSVAADLVASFRGLPGRVVLRPTRIYGRLLQDAFHPHVLGDAVDRDRHFDRLWIGARDRGLGSKVIEAEHRDLWRGDVPYFTASTDGAQVRDADGEPVQGLAENGTAGLERRLACLGQEETDRQALLIHQAFELRLAEDGQRPRPQSRSDPRPAVSADEVLHTALTAADRLVDRAFVDASGARWWAPRRLGAGRFTLAEAGPGLYEGLAGIALFLVRAARLGGVERHREVAEAAVAGLRARLGEDDRALAVAGLDGIGAFDGWGGVIYALVELVADLGDPSLLRSAEDQAERLLRLLPEDRRFDVLGGAAGAILALLRLDRAAPGRGALEAARSCGEHLLDHAVEVPVGRAWPPSGEASGPLAGLSHGASGAAWALAELGTAVGEGPDGPFTVAARDALAYEATLFDPASGNWRDLRARPEEAKDRHLVAWCHGAPGCGSARLGILQALGDRRLPWTEGLVGEVRAAVETTAEQGFGLTHSLCHGDLGNLDFLLEAAAAGFLSVDALGPRIAGVRRSVEHQGFLFGSPGGTDPPGLLLGTAGIGYGLLRAAAPDRVPSVLRLASASRDPLPDPPRPRSSGASKARGPERPQNLETP